MKPADQYRRFVRWSDECQASVPLLPFSGTDLGHQGSVATIESVFAIAKPRDYDSGALKIIRSSIEELQQRYSRELMRKKMLERPELADAPRTPDNSVFWLGRPPRTVAECMWISDQITEGGEQWKSDYPQIFSFAS